MKLVTTYILLLEALRCSMTLATSHPSNNYLDRAIVNFCNKASRHKPLAYSIFQGESALRKDGSDYQVSKSKAYNALWLLLHGKSDAAHEVVLGVKPTNVADAEYAAAHPGTWKEPLSDLDDWIHSLIHRSIEGDALGEGKHTGWENACYWAAGGPKQKKKLSCRNKKLIEAAHSTSLYTELVPRFGKSHEIVAAGGRTRRVEVAAGTWDPIAFVRLHSRAKELAGAQKIELEILRQEELKYILGKA